MHTNIYQLPNLRSITHIPYRNSTPAHPHFENCPGANHEAPDEDAEEDRQDRSGLPQLADRRRGSDRAGTAGMFREEQVEHWMPCQVL